MSFFTESESDPSVEQKRKYAVITNLGAESDFTVFNSNFCWRKSLTSLLDSL